MADILDFKEKKLERLAPSQLTSVLMRLPAKKRMEMILDRSDSEAVVAALNPNDFFFTVQEIGPDDALPILALGSVEQINHLFDMEWWRKDSIDPARALAWLDRLGRAGGPRLLEWIYKADFELLIALFKQWVVVETAPDDVDLLESKDTLPPKTLDDVYFWEARYPQYDELIFQLLNLIYEVNYGFFKELLNHVIYAPALEVDELAYGFHRARLDDNFVPDYYDSLEIYRAIKPEELLLKQPISEEDEKIPAPSFALALVPEGTLLEQVLRRVDNPQLAETLQRELASLSNKVIIADQLPFDSPDALHAAVGKALAYVNLGLEKISGGDTALARTRIEDLFLEHLFRLGQEDVARIRGRLRKVVKFGWIGQCPGKTRCLDGVWFAVAEELLAKTPKLIREAPESTGREDFFRTSRDLALANHHIDVMIAAGYLFKALGADLKALEPKLWEESQVSSIEDVSLGVMVFTAAAQFLSAGEWIVEPLPAAGWPDLFPLLDAGAMEKAILEWVRGILPESKKRELVREYLSPLLRDYIAEIEAFRGKEPPEAHLFPYFMFQETRIQT